MSISTSPSKKEKESHHIHKPSHVVRLEIKRLNDYEAIMRGQEAYDMANVPNNLCACSQHVPTYVAASAAGRAMVTEFFDALGWKKLGNFNAVDPKIQDINFLWLTPAEFTAALKNGTMTPGKQLINHLPKSYMITNKFNLARRLQSVEAPFIPKTYIFKHDESQEILDKIEMFFNKKTNMWIAKRGANSQGRDIQVIKDVNDLKKLTYDMGHKGWLIQKYLRAPLLLENRKFDLRVFLLVTNADPLVAFYHPGYARLCCRDYDTKATEYSCHLTNQAVQKKDPVFEQFRDDTTWSIHKINDYLNERSLQPQDWFITTLQRKIRHIMRSLVTVVRPNCTKNFGCFELFGCDVLIDANLKVWLIEVNSEPSLNRGTTLKKTLVPSILQEALALTLECYAKHVDDEPIFPLATQRTFQILVNETKSRPAYETPAAAPKKRKSHKPKEKAKPKPIPEEEEQYAQVDENLTTEKVKVESRYIVGFPELLEPEPEETIPKGPITGYPIFEKPPPSNTTSPLLVGSALFSSLKKAALFKDRETQTSSTKAKAKGKKKKKKQKVKKGDWSTSLTTSPDSATANELVSFSKFHTIMTNANHSVPKKRWFLSCLKKEARH